MKHVFWFFLPLAVVDSFQLANTPGSSCLYRSALHLAPTDLDWTVVQQTVTQDLPSLLSQGKQFINEVPAEAKTAATAGVAAAPVVSLGSFANKVFKSQKDRPTDNTYPEASAAAYEMSDVAMLEFGPAAFVRPLLKSTQLEWKNLQVAYDANKDGYDAQIFHKKVDGKGAAIILAKAGGKWFGGYNPRGWASLGGSRPSRAAFVFYKKPFGGWQKLRAMGGGGMACGSDLYDRGIYMGAEALVIPLNGADPRSATSRLGTYFESGPENRSTLLPRAGEDCRLQELKVLVGVYAAGEEIPNSGGVLDLGLY